MKQTKSDEAAFVAVFLFIIFSNSAISEVVDGENSGSEKFCGRSSFAS